MASDELLTLQEAAGRLRVHYMTAYRWVRGGQLAAFKAGGRLRVRARDLDRFMADREVDVGSPSDGHRRTDWPLHTKRLLDHLLTGDAVASSARVRKVVKDGAPAGDVYLRLLTPALHAIGEGWAQGEVSVAVEHRATEICRLVMAQLAEYFRRPGPRRGIGVTLTPPGESHGLGAAMAADFLQAGGYHVHHLGADVPFAGLRDFLMTEPADVVCVSLTRPCSDLDAVVAAASPAPVLVGGQGAEQVAVRAAGAVPVASLADLAPTVGRLSLTA